MQPKDRQKEGYLARQADSIIDRELAKEAIRMTDRQADKQTARQTRVKENNIKTNNSRLQT